MKFIGIIGVAIGGLLPIQAQGTVIPLPIDSEHFSPVITPEGDVSPEDCATFAILDEPQEGKVLSIGPWKAGLWSARFEYRENIPLIIGKVSGYYKTETEGPSRASVRVSYYKGSTRILHRDYVLPPSSEFSFFSIPFYYPPPGGVDSVRVGFGLVYYDEGRVLFSRLELSDELSTQVFPEELPPITRPNPTLCWAPGANYRVEAADNLWWLISPQGSPFYSLATPTINFGSTEQGLQGREIMLELGLNSVAGWSSEYLWRRINDSLEQSGEPALPFFYAMESGTLPDSFDRLIDANGNGPTGGHAFPDPYDPRFASAYRNRAQEVLNEVGDRPWFVGWFADNEIDFENIHRRVYSPSCAQRLKQFLQERYGSIESLNQTWVKSYGSFEQLIAQKPDPILRTGKMYEDFRDFSRVVIHDYIRLTIDLFHSMDPNRLVFSNRFDVSSVSDWADPEVMELFKAYDGIGVNLYPQNLVAGLDGTESAILEWITEQTGLPILIGEWSIPALDSDFYDDPDLLDWSFDEVVGTQEQRARQAAQVTLGFFNLPFVIGSHWFTWKDYDSTERRANRGLFHADGTTPWTELQQALKKAHLQIATPMSGNESRCGEEQIAEELEQEDGGNGDAGVVEAPGADHDTHDTFVGETHIFEYDTVSGCGCGYDRCLHLVDIFFIVLALVFLQFFRWMV